MPERERLRDIFAELTRRYSRLVFWKHIDRALMGVGDIDTFGVREEMDAVSADFINLALETIPGARVAIVCRHLWNARRTLVIVDDCYPSLVEFDVGCVARRLSVAWLNGDLAAEFSMINAEGIRVLRPGALAVALFLLYGVSREGKQRLKTHDHYAITAGFATDRATAHEFSRRALPARVADRMDDFADALEGGKWDERGVRRVFYSLVIAGTLEALRFAGAPLLQAARDRRRDSCTVGKTILENKRCAGGREWKEFANYCAADHEVRSKAVPQLVGRST